MKDTIRVFVWVGVMGLLLASCGPGPAATAASSPSTPPRPSLSPVLTAAPIETLPAPTVIPMTGTHDQPLVLHQLNPSPPVDVITEMQYFAGGADAPWDCPLLQEGQVLEMRQPDALDLNFCWDGADASVNVTVTRPDGQKDTMVLPVKRFGESFYIDGSYQAGLTRPAGVYQFRLSGSRQETVFSVNFAPPVLPVMYEVYPAGAPLLSYTAGPRHRLHLAGFAPGETLQLMLYRSGERLEFLGWQTVVVGMDGQLWLDTDFDVQPDDPLALIAIGPVSGEVHLYGKQGITLPLFRAECPGAPQSRLHADQTAVANRVQRVYKELSEKSTIAGYVDSTARITLRTGPYCLNSDLWWYFSTENDGVYGYTRETSGQEYLLEPGR